MSPCASVTVGCIIRFRCLLWRRKIHFRIPFRSFVDGERPTLLRDGFFLRAALFVAILNITPVVIFLAPCLSFFTRLFLWRWYFRLWSCSTLLRRHRILFYMLAIRRAIVFVHFGSL